MHLGRSGRFATLGDGQRWCRPARIGQFRVGFSADLYITEVSSRGPPLESTGLALARGKVRTSGAAGQARSIGSVAVARSVRPSGNRGQRAVWRTDGAAVK